LWLITTPSARLRMLCGFFLIAQPPLLGEEGNGSYVTIVANRSTKAGSRECCATLKDDKTEEC
jgi:hypothetical protein